MNTHDRWFDGIARNLILHAAGKTPPTLSERLGEEWLADLTARSGAFSQLRFALGCLWATNVIAHEFGPPVRAAAAAAGSKATVVHDPGPGPSFSRRTTVILVIIGLHVLVIGVLAAAIEAPNIFKPSPPPPRIDVSFVPRPEPPVPPTAVDPTLDTIRLVDPKPPVGPIVPPERTDAIREQFAEGPSVVPVGPPVPRSLNRVPGGPGAGFPNPDDFYPPQAIRMRQWGIATVSVCVDSAGRLNGQPTIDHSTGIASLDEAALKLAKAGSGHYRPTTEAGRPVSACYPFNVRFRLQE